MKKQKHRVLCIYIQRAPHAEMVEDKERKLLESLAEASLRITSQVAFRGEKAVFLEIGKSLGIYREESILMRAQVLCRRLGVRAELSVAEDAPTSLAFAMWKTREKARLPIHALEIYLSPFEVNFDLRKRLKWIFETLKLLGVETLGDFQKLPRETLSSRFGELGAAMARSIQFASQIPWPQWHPAEALQEEEWTDRCEEPTALHFFLKRVLDRVMTRLRGRGRRLARLSLTLEMAPYRFLKNRIREMKVTLPIPQSSTQAVFPVIYERLSQWLAQEPLLAPLDHMRVEVLETSPARGAQRDFLDSTEQEQEDWSVLAGRLIQKLGREKVFRVQTLERYLPEASWMRVPIIENRDLPQGGFFPGVRIRESPTRLLKSPRPLRMLGSTIAESGDQGSASWVVEDWKGPQRISGEWWLDPARSGFSRDYYRIDTKTGESLWVYFERMESGKLQLFLHGFFD